MQVLKIRSSVPVNFLFIFFSLLYESVCKELKRFVKSTSTLIPVLEIRNHDLDPRQKLGSGRGFNKGLLEPGMSQGPEGLYQDLQSKNKASKYTLEGLAS